MDKEVVIHYVNGTVVRGRTADFHQRKPDFHVSALDGRILTVPVHQLKAVFFVRSLNGNPRRTDAPGYGSGYGRRARVLFVDGEVIEGRVESINREGAGFFLEPGDPDSNNERVFCVLAAVSDVNVQAYATGSLPAQRSGK